MSHSQPTYTLATCAGSLRLRSATAEDAEVIAAIHEDTMRWAFERGFRAQGPYPTLREDALARIARHHAYIAVIGDTPAATVTLTSDPHPLWADQPGEAMYLHALAVARAFAGAEVGRALLRWATGLTAKAGYTALRLECDAANPVLRAYYERAGFAPRGEVVAGERRLARFERAVSAADGQWCEADAQTDMAMPQEPDTLTIRPAQMADLDEVVAIEEDATSWLRSRGIDPGQPPRPLREIFAERIARGQMYVALIGGQPAANMALTSQDDLWTDLPGSALYVHGLMVRRVFAGRQIGRELLRWAEKRAAEQGKPLLRLDCNADNLALRAYYEGAGFTPRGEVVLPHRVAARLERTTEA
jgi:ribosomal protein S18 acetylase RimI-like enzyme